MPRWAKLSESISEDLTIAEMLGKPSDARAALLFLMSLPRADLYGVLPGNPRLFKARVCPVSHITETTVKTALSLLVERRMFKSFSDKGQTYLLIANYHKYQLVRWNNWVGPPAAELPDDWEPPEELVSFVAKLSPERRQPYTVKIPALASLLPTTTVDYSSLPTTTVTDVDVDVDVDTDKETATRAREGNYNQKPYDPIEVSAMLKGAVPDDIWSPLVFRWSKPVADILNASSEDLTLSELYDMLKENPPTLTDKWPDTYIAKLKRAREIDRTGALIRRLEKK